MECGGDVERVVRRFTGERALGVALVVASAVLTPAVASGQVGTAGLVVRATAGDGVPLGGVAIVVHSVETGLGRSATTDADGQATFRALPPGSWQVSASHDGFRGLGEQPVVLRVGQTASMRVTLLPVASETVTVSGAMPVVEVAKREPSTNILPDQIATLPVADRQYERLAFLAPAVQTDPSRFFDRGGTPVVGGAASAWGNGYLLDGIDSTGSHGQPTLRISQDAIREFRVTTQQHDAEIGLSAGGVLSIVTRSGTNQLRGSVFGFYRADALRARGALEEEGADFSRYHAGFTLGGPLVRDRTHYFASVEHMDDDNMVFFRPGGVFADLAADLPHPTEQTLALLSLDHSFSGSSSGFAKVAAERHREANYQAGGVSALSHGWAFDYDTVMLSLGHTGVVADARLNELRAQVSVLNADSPLNSDDRGEYFTFGTTLQTGANPNGTFWLDSEVLKLQDTLHWQAGRRHELKGGLAYQHHRHETFNARFEHGLLWYATDSRQVPLLYFFGTGSAEVGHTTDIIGAFVQDDWRWTSRLTVGVGLRYDVDLDSSNPELEHPLASGRSVDADNLQPRLGLTWDLTGDGRTVLRGGVGRYVGRYLQFPAFLELQYNGATGRVLQSRVNAPPDFPLDPDDPDTTGFLLPPDLVMLADDLEPPESTQASLGVSHRLGGTRLVLDVEALYADGRHELVYRDTNWKGNDDPCQEDPNPAFACRIIPGLGRVDTYASEGTSRYRALVVGVSGTLGGGHLLNASVTVADKQNIWDDAITMATPSDPADIEAEWGRSNTDERYRLVVSGVFRLPWGLTLSPVYEYGSGRPWNRLLGYDANFDAAVGDRPEGSTRNDQDGPPFRQLSLRLTKAIPLAGQGELELVVECFNVFDTTNYDVTSVDSAMRRSELQPDGSLVDVPNPRFGIYTATLPPREVQLGLRWVF